MLRTTLRKNLEGNLRSRRVGEARRCRYHWSRNRLKKYNKFGSAFSRHFNLPFALTSSSFVACSQSFPTTLRSFHQVIKPQTTPTCIHMDFYTYEEIDLIPERLLTTSGYEQSIRNWSFFPASGCLRRTQIELVCHILQDLDVSDSIHPSKLHGLNT